MNRVNLYVSSKDVDLVYIAQRIGIRNFRRVASLCLRGVFDQRSAEMARAIALNPPSNVTDPPKFIRGGLRIILSFKGEKSLPVAELLSSVKKDQKGLFIKTCIRQVLGIKATLFGFLDKNIVNEASIYEAQNAAAILVVGKGVEQKDPSKKKTKTNRKEAAFSKEQEEKVEELFDTPKVEVAPERELTYDLPAELEELPTAIDESAETNDGEMDLLSMLEMMM